jgi:hypothetical protein
MKHVIAFATISACLLVLSGGAALAADPPRLNTGTAQPGHNPTTMSGLNCSNGGLAAGPSTGAINATGSPFNPSGTGGLNYAGTGANTTSANPLNAFANYDVACFQATQHP